MKRALVALVALVLAGGAALAQQAGPKIQLNYPSADLQTDREAIPVLGVISDDAGVKSLELTVNGTRVQVAQPDASAPPPSVRLTARATLVMGKNAIVFIATNTAGQSTQVTRTVTRVAPTPVGAPPPPPAAPAKKFPERYAVIIGNGAYENPGIPPVRFAERDAQALYELLTTKAGFKTENVQLVIDSAQTKPTLAAINQALGPWLRRANREDFVLVYFAGRGATEVDASGSSRDGLGKYILTYDTDPESLFSTALAQAKLVEAFERVRSDRVVFLVDADFSGNPNGRSFSRQATRALPSADFMDRLAKSSGRAYISASGPNEPARELADMRHGLFTYYLLQGLDGAADNDKDGVVALAELYGYVQGKVIEHARRLGFRQSPNLQGTLTDVPIVELPKR